jgi:hypothetical protein
MIYAAYSGDPKIFERGLALQSVLGNVPPTLQPPLTTAPPQPSRSSPPRRRESPRKSHVMGTMDLDRGLQTNLL